MRDPLAGIVLLAFVALWSVLLARVLFPWLIRRERARRAADPNRMRYVRFRLFLRNTRRHLR